MGTTRPFEARSLARSAAARRGHNYSTFRGHHTIMQNACNTKRLNQHGHACARARLHICSTLALPVRRRGVSPRRHTAPRRHLPIGRCFRDEVKLQLPRVHTVFAAKWAVECLNTKTPAQPAAVTSCVCSCPSEAADASLSLIMNGRPAAFSGHWWTHGPGRLGRQRSPRRRRGPDISAEAIRARVSR